MSAVNKPEVWLRGPLPGITPALQPVAHALLQAREEFNELMKDFNGELLWQRPAGAASPGFHLQHLTGVLERLFSYAKGKMLTESQLKQLAAEGKHDNPGQTVQYLVAQFNEQVDKSLVQLSETSADELFEIRTVGRAKIPSTVIGLLFHAAEHTMRHLGQLLVTLKVVSRN
jgi:uncharacterized damage-inducible protein DinB